MLCHLCSFDHLACGGHIEDVEDAVAIVRVNFHLRTNFIVSHRPVISNWNIQMLEKKTIYPPLTVGPNYKMVPFNRTQNPRALPTKVLKRA